MGMTTLDVASLVHFGEISKAVVAYDIERRSVIQNAAIPWPVKWLLSRHSPKHRFCGKRLPSPVDTLKEVDFFLNKLRWRYAFRRSSGAPCVRVKNSRVCGKCSEPMPHDLQNWCGYFRDYMDKAVRKAREAARWQKSYVNTCELYYVALSIMRRRGWVAVPQDKLGGFVIMSKDDRLRVEEGITSTCVYKKVEDYEIDRGELTTEARKLIKAIANHENDPELIRELGKPITRGYAHVGKLQETIKTHKDPGKVTARALHAAADCCFEGIGRYVSFKIRAQLQEYAGCIMSDAPMVCARLRKLSVTATSRFLRIDVKDFFYSGTVDDVVRDFQGVFHRHQRVKCLIDAVRFLTDNQYIVTRTGDMFKVVRGSGMGLTQSADLVDSLFYSRVDRMMGRPKFRAAYGIIDYLRYRDDILIVYDGVRGKIEQLKSQLRVSAAYFRLEVEDENVAETIFLDIALSIEDSKVICRYHHKPGKGPPLSCTSAHPTKTQRWPAGLVRRIRTICTRECDADNAISVLRMRFNKFCVPLDKSFDKSDDKYVGMPRLSDKNSSTLWCPLGYHPAAKSFLSKACVQFCHDFRHLTESLFYGDLCMGSRFDVIKVAWFNKMPSLLLTVRNMEVGWGR